MPYYADPLSLLAINENVTTIPDPETDPGGFAAFIAKYDGMVTPRIRATLLSRFRVDTIPAPTSTNDTILATLWLCLMTHEIQSGKFGVNRNPGESSIGKEKKDLYDELIKLVMSGAMVLEGALPVGAIPVFSNTGIVPTRTTPYDQNNAEPCPRRHFDLFMHGLRL